MKWSSGPSTSCVFPRIISALLLSVIIFPAAAQSAVSGPKSVSSSAPRLEPDERASTFAAAEASGTLDWSLMLDLALWASGASAASTEKARAAIVSAATELRESVADSGTGPASVRGRAEYVLAFMHKRFLKAYSERQTRLDALVETGRYNCVSSAALYVVLASSIDLDVQGVSTVDHAFCSVLVGDERIDVETTSPYGFDPGSRIEFQDEFGRATGFAYVSPRNYRDRSSISRLELLSLIFSNRTVELEAAGRYSEAVGLALDRRTLLAAGGKGAARAEEELLDRLLNYGTSLARSGREAEALAWVDRAVAVFGPHPRWKDFVEAAANNYLTAFVKAGRIAEARAELGRLEPTLGETARRNLDRLVTDAELVKLIGAAADGASTAAAVTAIAAAMDRGAVAEGRGRELTVYAQLKQIERIARAEGWAAAIAATEEAIATGSDRKLTDALRVYRSNRLAELHNAFASLYNSGRYADAKRAVQEAIAEFPAERRLQDDLAAVERALAR